MIQRNPWNEVAQVYEEVRPSYHDRLIQDIIDNTRISPGDRLLELGAGTGKATVQFARKGFNIHCVEPGQNLADILIQKCSCFPNVDIDINTFEQWIPPKNVKFDLIFCAQAFNWIDPEIRYRKSYQLLKDDGYLVLFWYGGANDSWESDIVASGLFLEPQTFNYHSEFTSDVESSIKAEESTSTFVHLSEDEKNRARDKVRKNIEQQGGVVTVKMDYKMYLAKRV